MILRRYGDRVHSVEPNFDPHALTEVAFRKDGSWKGPAEEFASTYRKLEERELGPETTGWVQSETEAELLRALERSLREWEASLGEAEVLVVENAPGVDHPKTRERRETRVVEGENRHHFHRWIEPPLRVGRYERAG